MPPLRKKTSKKVTKKAPTKRKASSRRAPSTPAVVLPTSKSLNATSWKDYITVFYGQAGIGKTTFANSLGEVLFLSTDRGTRFIEAMRVEILSWDDCLKTITLLEKSSRQYDAIVIDHVDDWARYAEEHTCKKLGIEALADAQWGKGWAAYRKEIYQFITRLKRLRVGIVFLAHEATTKVKIRGIEVDVTKPQMNKQAWDAIIPLADLVGHCALHRVKRKGQQKSEEIRVLRTNPREDLWAKDRIAQRSRPKGRDWEALDGQAFLDTFTGKVR